MSDARARIREKVMDALMSQWPVSFHSKAAFRMDADDDLDALTDDDLAALLGVKWEVVACRDHPSCPPPKRRLVGPWQPIPTTPTQPSGPST